MHSPVGGSLFISGLAPGYCDDVDDDDYDDDDDDDEPVGFRMPKPHTYTKIKDGRYFCIFEPSQEGETKCRTPDKAFRSQTKLKLVTSNP
jgi:hypothetical protein